MVLAMITLGREAIMSNANGLNVIEHNTHIMTYERCRKIEFLIKNLSSTQIEELFKIFQRNKCQYTVNNNGVFLNLSWLEEPILCDIEHFVAFCLESKQALDKYEAIYQHLNQSFHDTITPLDGEVLDTDANTNNNNNNNKENGLIDKDSDVLEITEEQCDTIMVNTDIKRIISRISSSMKFYLFKKKFSKNMIPGNLTHVNERLMKEAVML